MTDRTEPTTEEDLVMAFRYEATPSAVTIERRDTLLSAAKALVLAGWCENYFAKDAAGAPMMFREIVTDPGRGKEFCARGAVFAACGDDFAAARALEESLRATIFEKLDSSSNSSLARYNNAKGWTKFEVAALFDLAKESRQ